MRLLRYSLRVLMLAAAQMYPTAILDLLRAGKLVLLLLLLL